MSSGVPLIASVLVACCANAKEMMTSWQLCSATAQAVAQLCEGNVENQVAMGDNGVVPALVSMLASPNSEMQANAAHAISSLTHNNADLQGSVARTGAIAPLCALMKEGSEEVRDAAAGAVWALAAENTANKATIAKLGGIEPLVGLVVGGGADAEQKNSMGALISLVSKSNDNREAVFKLIVTKLASRIAMLQTAGGAGKCHQQTPLGIP